MAAVRCFKELIVWQKAMLLVRAVYDVTDGFPKAERYALADQLIRAAVSVPSNIAEGFGRNTDRDFAHFLAQARGSLFEAETQLLIALDRLYIPDMEGLAPLIEEIGKMLNGLISKLTTNPKLSNSH